MLLLLQTRGRMTASALARELEVSVRTIYRDLGALSEAGVPVYAEPGPNGGCQLVDGYRTRLTGLTGPEAEALFLGGVPTAVGQLGLGTVLAAAQLKVLAALPPELRSRAARVQERFHVDAPGWFRRPDDVPALPALAEALWSERRVDVRYERGSRVVSRVLDPLGLVLKGGTWYLVARTKGEVRTYRVSRVQRVSLRDEQFERPVGFDLAAHWESAAAGFEVVRNRVEVEARVTPFALGRLGEALEPGAAQTALDSAQGPDAEGWTTVRFKVEHVDYAHDMLLRLGAGIEVMSPPALRARLASTANALAAQYSTQ